jgi:hypothetical protein
VNTAKTVRPRTVLVYVLSCYFGLLILCSALALATRPDAETGALIREVGPIRAVEILNGLRR